MISYSFNLIPSPYKEVFSYSDGLSILSRKTVTSKNFIVKFTHPNYKEYKFIIYLVRHKLEIALQNNQVKSLLFIFVFFVMIQMNHFLSKDFMILILLLMFLII